MSMRSNKWELPLLSVPHERAITAEDSPLAGAGGTSTIKPTNDPSSSRLAMVRKGSPRANANGAVARVSSSENQGAALVFLPSWESQPPITTLSPSAFASIRKTSPSCSIPAICKLRCYFSEAGCGTNI